MDKLVGHIPTQLFQLLSSFLLSLPAHHIRGVYQKSADNDRCSHCSKWISFHGFFPFKSLFLFLLDDDRKKWLQFLSTSTGFDQKLSYNHNRTQFSRSYFTEFLLSISPLCNLRPYVFNLKVSKLIERKYLARATTKHIQLPLHHASDTCTLYIYKCGKFNGHGPLMLLTMLTDV